MTFYESIKKICDPHASALGKKGGSAGRGAAKARTSEQARAAAQARWAKRQPTKYCGCCDGTGLIDGYEEDPNWYAPGEMKPCPMCRA